MEEGRGKDTLNEGLDTLKGGHRTGGGGQECPRSIEHVLKGGLDEAVEGRVTELVGEALGLAWQAGWFAGMTAAAQMVVKKFGAGHPVLAELLFWRDQVGPGGDGKDAERGRRGDAEKEAGK